MCNEPILRHELFNLAEGSLVVNMTLHLLEAGPAHCDEQDGALLARWRQHLESALEYHQRNMAFERLWKRFSGRCETLREAEGFSQSIGRGRYRDLNCTASAVPSCRARAELQARVRRYDPVVLGSS